jgi:hypothetical protein
MCAALIGGREGLSCSSLSDSAARAGFELWFQGGADLDLAPGTANLEALFSISERVPSRAEEQARDPAKAHCIPSLCTSCEGAALCGI